VPAVVKDSLGITTGFSEQLKTGPLLGDAAPNPAKRTTVVECFVPQNEEMAILQFVDLGSGKVTNSKVLNERGRLSIEIDLSQFPSGVFGYQIILKENKLGAKRFIVLK